MNRFAASAAQAVKGTVVIRKIPRTALVSDVRRMLDSYKVDQVKNVHLDYNRFMFTGKAYVTFTNPAYADPAFHQLRAAQMSGMPLDVTATTYTVTDDSTIRTRGVRGRDEAMQRGALDGNGPLVVGAERGKNVVIWGLPGRMTADQLKNVLRSYRLAGTGGGMEDILKVENMGRSALTSRHYVRTASISEAHRLVRRMHMSSFDQAGRQYVVRARVI